jgi:hypothetical protein
MAALKMAGIDFDGQIHSNCCCFVGLGRRTLPKWTGLEEAVEIRRNCCFWKMADDDDGPTALQEVEMVEEIEERGMVEAAANNLNWPWTKMMMKKWWIGILMIGRIRMMKITEKFGLFLLFKEHSLTKEEMREYGSKKEKILANYK